MWVNLRIVSDKKGIVFERDGAIDLNIIFLSREDKRSVMTSAAALLGAQARILVFGSLSKIWRIASTIVTVFPVPGLKYNLTQYEKYFFQ